MAELEVSTDALLASAVTLDGVAAFGRRVHGARASLLGCCGQVADAAGQAALEAYLHRWCSELGTLAADAQTVGDVLRRAADTYTTVEGVLTRGAR
ncbi:MAG TPA: hypothetical protein VGD03_13885 [Frankiaceae bacterium]|jgi:hypothetical protein